MTIERFEDILVWQKAKVFVLDIYKNFIFCKDYSFKDQILRAAVSIMNNIAEGYEKETNKDFKKFLFISKGSCGEVRSMLYLALSLNYISNSDFNNFYTKSIEISKIISGLIKKL
ncbi:MAG TPA: four helix bundle protein [Candidatus Woesebacteria bacterium]|nr:four helix bundle protein [Candidatus Woesebacteria bacterium]